MFEMMLYLLFLLLCPFFSGVAVLHEKLHEAFYFEDFMQYELFVAPEESFEIFIHSSKWSGREDLNLRPFGPEPNALPS